MSFSQVDDEDWMNVNVDLKVPSFEGIFKCTIQLNEFNEFLDMLRKLNDSIGKECKCEWGNMEENVKFIFNLTKQGQMECSYYFSPDNFSLGPTLSGHFITDQSYLNDWITQAKSVIVNAR